MQSKTNGLILKANLAKLEFKSEGKNLSVLKSFFMHNAKHQVPQFGFICIISR